MAAGKVSCFPACSYISLKGFLVMHCTLMSFGILQLCFYVFMDVSLFKTHHFTSEHTAWPRVEVDALSDCYKTSTSRF